MVPLTLTRCSTSTGSADTPQQVTLRVGLGQVATANAIGGLRQLARIFSNEGLVTVSDDGRPRPALAERWTTSADGRTLSIYLRTGAKFHDGTPATAQTIVSILRRTLPQWMGPVYADIDTIESSGDLEVKVHLNRPSQFVIEALEAPLVGPEHAAGTGPFEPVGSDLTEFRANASYYRGRPRLDRIQVQTYPSIRTAWAEMLRGHVDLLYEVSPDALDSFTGARSIQVFTYTRHYQYVVVFNSAVPAFADPAVRRALNLAIDRESIIKDALNGHGLASYGPLSPSHWAFRRTAPLTQFDPQAAAALLSTKPKLHFVCLVPPESERIALIIQRQLEQVGVGMEIREVTAEQFLDAFAKHNFDAVLTDFISGPTLFRLYQFWHSQGTLRGNVGDLRLDIALDAIRAASTAEEYQTAVAEMQSVFASDPPGIFVAWGERARALSRRFEVPTAGDRDVITTLRLWRPANAAALAARN